MSKKTRNTPSLVERLVRNHPQGTIPTEGILDTPEKIRAYVERMHAATEARLRADRRARWASFNRARTQPVD